MASTAAATRFAALRGSFHRRAIKGGTYVYFNFRDIDGRVRSVYVGAEGNRVRSLVEAFESSEASVLRDAMAKRANACIALGCHALPNKHFKIINKLAGYGLFRRGSMLIGSQAFLVLGSVLGVRWVGRGTLLDAGTEPTEGGILVASPAGGTPQTGETVASLEMGQLPMQALPHYAADSSHAIRASDLGIAVEQTSFVDFLLERPTAGVAFAKAGACFVNLPDPARFAVYLLAGSADRSAGEAGRSLDRLEMAAALIAWHLDQGRVDYLVEAWNGALGLGTGWRQLAAKGQRLLSKSHPELAEAFAAAPAD